MIKQKHTEKIQISLKFSLIFQACMLIVHITFRAFGSQYTTSSCCQNHRVSSPDLSPISYLLFLREIIENSSEHSELYKLIEANIVPYLLYALANTGHCDSQRQAAHTLQVLPIHTTCKGNVLHM